MARVQRRLRREQIRSARSDRPIQRRALAHRLAAPGTGRHRHGTGATDARGRHVPQHTAHDRRRALRFEWRRLRRSVRAGHRQDAMGRAPARGGRERLWRRFDARYRLLGRWRRRPHPGSTQRVPARARSEDRPADPELRYEWPRLPLRRHGRRHALYVDRRAVRDRRRRRPRHVAARRFREQRGYAQRRARLRRAHGQTALDVPRHSAGRRIRRRDVGSRFVAVLGACARVVAVFRRPGARARVHAHHCADERHVRRAPARRQLVHAEHRRRGGGHGQTRLALPNRAPRSLGLRSAGSADPHGHQRRRLGR